MQINDSVLWNSEKIIFGLRNLFWTRGYAPYRMSKFEEYDLYAKNKEFLVSDNVITFTDTGGKLMALKPDVTLSIIKNTADDPNAVRRLFYNENVYRVSESTGAFKEIMQSGVECFGGIGEEEVFEVLCLAAESLRLISEDSVLAVNCLGTAQPEPQTPENPQSMDAKASDSAYRSLLARLAASPYADMIREDASVSGDDNYYNGIVFRGYVKDVPTAVLSGGRYDKLMRKLGRRSNAIGFAVYVDALERFDPEKASGEDAWLNVALPKGRLGETVYGLFADAGFDCPELLDPKRKLVFENPEKKLRFFWVKPSDVAIYVERGAADIGVVGKDILLEQEADVLELLDLQRGCCFMAAAGPADTDPDRIQTLRVATKFPHIARKYYQAKGRDIDVIKLNGSIEIAPILGLSDIIVDIVETGTTLRENKLEVKERIADISARLIANKSAYSFKSGRMDALKEGLARAGAQ